MEKQKTTKNKNNKRKKNILKKLKLESLKMFSTLEHLIWNFTELNRINWSLKKFRSQNVSFNTSKFDF